MRKFWPSLAILPLLGVFLTGCPKPATPPQPMRPSITDSRPANSKPGGFLGQPSKTGNSRPQSTSATADEPMDVLGNPDGATASPSNKEHFLMRRPQFDLSYNDSLHFPNWVAWHLVASDIGDTERGNFVPDPDLPDGFARITTRDYSSSGYDRGHNCPSKDRTASKADNDVAFYMTNITPQQHGMNAGPWEKLETYCRKLAQEGNELYILCGHGFRDKNFNTIGSDKIAVPDFGWKIIVVLPNKTGNDLERVDTDTRVIAVQMPNISTISKQPWDKYITTVAELEQATGLTFFESLHESVARVLKPKQDAGANSFGGSTSGFSRGTRRGSGGSFGAGGRR
ncbi:DNA/RNA non-specific endonuclease [Armatimonas sp.]|uniref:DNA/RNA non-specific endonuclease n=1 Tax=Armatimonas sp. TaxID=1872638 RepID=UPI0037500772